MSFGKIPMFAALTDAFGLRNYRCFIGTHKIASTRAQNLDPIFDLCYTCVLNNLMEEL